MGKGIFINLIFYYFYFILLSLFMETCILQVFVFTPSSQGRVQIFPAGTRELVGRGGEVVSASSSHCTLEAGGCAVRVTEASPPLWAEQSSSSIWLWPPCCSSALVAQHFGGGDGEVLQELCVALSH